MKHFSGISIIFLLTTISHAEETPFYASVGLYRADYTIENIEESDTGLFGVDLGYALNNRIAFEISYQDFGEIAVENLRAEASAYQLTAVASQAITKKLDAYLKVGLDFWDSEVTGASDAGSVSFSDNGTDIYYGLGGEFMIHELATVFVEYQWHSESDLEVYGVGVKQYIDFNAILR